MDKMKAKLLKKLAQDIAIGVTIILLMSWFVSASL